MSTQLRRIAAKAKQDPKARFTSLAHLLTPEFLRDTWRQLNRKGASGIDGETITEFETNLEERIQDLWRRLRAGQYHAPPVRRVEIPKGNGKTRPLGIPTVEDRLLQRAVARIVSAIYEPDFLDCSFGYRPGRNPHMALKALRDHIVTGKVRHVYEADIQGYFTHINHEWLRKMIALRIADPVITGLIGKWLNAGVMEHGVIARPEAGTPQGGPISPPTKLQTFFFGIRIARVRIDPKHDIDVVSGHLHPLDQCPDEVALACPVGSLQTSAEFGRKIFEPSDNQLQFPVQGRFIYQRLALLLQAGEALTQARHPGLKLPLIDQAFGITVDQPGDALAQLADLAFDRGQRRAFAVRLRLQAAPIFFREPLRVVQQRTDFPPDRQVQQIRAHLRILTEPLTPKAVRVRAQTAVRGIRARLAFAGTGARRLP